METINIDRNIQDFKKVFEAESRIIFSAKFGDGKSYFLNKFIESYPKEANDYYFITLILSIMLWKIIKMLLNTSRETSCSN